MDSTRRIIAAALVLLFNGTVARAEQPTPDSTSQEVKAFEAMFGKGPQEEDVYKADRLLVTATGSQKPVHLAPSVASVITKEDIAAMGATTLDEALETVPGLHVDPSGSQWFSPTWTIRGIRTSVNPDVLLLINGVPFTSNYTGNRHMGFRMPVSMISRIEVVRGPGSALHGADAFSGVVNVITKDNFEIDGTQTGVRYGSFDTIDTWAQHGGQYGGWDLAFGLEWQKTQGDHGRIVDRDRMNAIGAVPLSKIAGPLDTKYDLLDSHLTLRRGDWSLHLSGSLADNGAGPGGAQAITDTTHQDSKSLLADLNYTNDHSLKDWSVEGRIYTSYIHQDTFVQYYPPGPYPAASPLNMVGEPIQTSTDGGLETSAIYKGLHDHQLRLGAGLKSYNFDRDQYKNFLFFPLRIVPWQQITDPNQIYIDKANRTLWYGLVQDEWQLAKHWTLTAGARYDEYSDFGSTVNPRAALVWETLYNLTTKLMYGTAFRAPSFSEQYVKNNPVTVGKPDLKPEEIETEELAFDYQPTTKIHLLLNLFTFRASDMIDLAPAVPPVALYMYDNVGTVEGKGFEMEGDWQMLPTLRIKANFAYQRARNTNTEALVADTPQTQFYLNPHWDFMPNWSLDGQYYWIGDRHRAQGDPRSDIKSYDLVNLTLRRTNIAKHWEAALAVRNLFDTDARSPSPLVTTPPLPPAGWGAYIPGDYPQEGRSVWAEVSCHF